MERPFDARMTRAMTDTAEDLARETNAAAAFVQSDEIYLLWRWRTAANPEGFQQLPLDLILNDHIS